MTAEQQLLLEQWKTASELHRHMDNVTWQRFNFFMATNGVLLAALAAVVASEAFNAGSRPRLLDLVTIAIPIVGAVISVVAFLVQKRGQAYHHYRCQQAREAEEALEKIEGKRLLRVYEKSLNDYVAQLPKGDLTFPLPLERYLTRKIGKWRTHTLIGWVALSFVGFWLLVLLILCALSVLCVLGTISGCGGKPDGYGGSFAWHSLSANYACETEPGQQGRVLYLVFCEDHPSETSFRAGAGGTMKLSNGTVVQLSFAKGRQFWVDKTGKVTALTEPFAAEQVKELADLNHSLPDEDIKNLQEIRALLDPNS